MSSIGVFSDLHLGKGAATIPFRLHDQESVWTQALQGFVDRGCDLVIFAGDATDKRQPSNEERDAFQRPLVGYPLPVVAISGNHDLSHADKPTAVDLAGQGGLLRASREPELIRVAGVVVATLPYTTPARIRTWCHDRGIDSEPDDVFAELACQVLESLAADAARLYPGLPVVQVGHYPTSGWAVPSGFETSLMRTVVLPLERIVRCGFAAAVYGDIHKPGEISVDPLVLSPGSPLPLDHGEASCEHGCYIVHLDERPARAEFVPLVSPRFLTIDVEVVGRDLPVSAGDALAEVIDAERIARDGLDDAIVRVRYTATAEQAREIDHRALEQAILDAGARHVKIEANVVRESRARVAGVTAELSPLEAVDLWAAAQGLDASLAKAVRVWTGEALEAVA